MHILIITGGISSERRISFMSAREVKKGLEVSGHKVKLYDLKKGKVTKGIVKEFDVIFPILHGEEGEGGILQEALSKIRKPYVGGNPKGFKKAWPKIPFKKFCDQSGYSTPQWEIVKSEKDVIRFGFPAVLKASTGGSSREVFILKSKRDLKKNAVQKLFKSGLKLFVEMSILGTEITCAILENKALPLIEIIPPDGQWFDYKNKYSGITQEIPFAPSLDKKMHHQIQKVALTIHKYFNLGTFSRTDFIVSEDTAYVLEVNTIPGLTASSLFPKAAQAAGLSFPKLLDKMVRSAYEGKISKTQ